MRGIRPYPPAMTVPLEATQKAGVSQDLASGGEVNWPLHGLRHPPKGDTSGWYLWTGELSDADDFFVPEVLAELAAPPGTRFLLAPGHRDVARRGAVERRDRQRIGAATDWSARAGNRAYVRDMWFWPVVGLTIGSGLGLLKFLDTRARRMGHHPRPGYGIYRSLRENRRDIRVFDAANGWLSTNQRLGWTSWHRRNADSARENRRDDTGE